MYTGTITFYVTKVVIDEAVIDGDAKPYMVIESEDSKRVASSND